MLDYCLLMIQFFKIYKTAQFVEQTQSKRFRELESGNGGIERVDRSTSNDGHGHISL